MILNTRTNEIRLTYFNDHIDIQESLLFNYKIKHRLYIDKIFYKYFKFYQLLNKNKLFKLKIIVHNKVKNGTYILVDKELKMRSIKSLMIKDYHPYRSNAEILVNLLDKPYKKAPEVEIKKRYIKFLKHIKGYYFLRSIDLK